jgi:hypothetical protein
MPIIAMCGPHAIGKTTAVRRWVERYHGLLDCISDSQMYIRWGGNADILDWKGTVEEKAALVKECRERRCVTVVESVRATVLNFLLPGEPIILVLCSGETMGRVLRERCARKGKPFNNDYWTKDNLEYESHLRYTNLVGKLGLETSCKQFFIEDQARDWSAVDEYFGSLFRRMNNQLVNHGLDNTDSRHLRLRQEHSDETCDGRIGVGRSVH